MTSELPQSTEQSILTRNGLHFAFVVVWVHWIQLIRGGSAAAQSKEQLKPRGQGLPAVRWVATKLSGKLDASAIGTNSASEDSS